MSKKNHDADVAFIQALAELLRENDLTELQVKREYAEDDSLNVRVSRHMGQHVSAAQTVSVAAAPAAAVAAPTPVAAPTQAAAPASADPADDPGAVPSPMVGTVYLQAEPDAPTFILSLIHI